MSAFAGIHFKAEEKLGILDKEERDIIHRLKKEFYVTAIGDIRLGISSNVKYALIKPTDDFIKLFNIEREIILIFTNYDEFEPRTLDAVDSVLGQYQSLRLEQVCSVIVSKDQNVGSKIRDLLKTDPESRILIPFTYKELIEDKIGSFLIKNRFQQYFYKRDLFAFESPLKKDLYFFGRTDLIHKLASRHASNENSGLFGLRKTGKTSIIFGLQRVFAKDHNYAIFIDCQDPSFHTRRWNEALFLIITLIKNQTKLALKTRPEDKYDEKNASISFISDLIKIYNKLEKKSLLLIFDEIEQMTFGISPSPHWRNGDDFIFFWQTMRSHFQKHSEKFTYLIVGTNPTCIEKPLINNYDNPIFNQVPFEYIPKFDFEQTKEMVDKLGKTMGLVFNNLVFANLTKDFGGHPFLIRHVCSEINNNISFNRPVSIGEGKYLKAKQSFNKNYSKYIEMILHVLKDFYHDEYDMLTFLANDDYVTFKEFAQNSPEYIKHLVGYGIINEEDNDYHFAIDAVKEYLILKNKYVKLNLSVNEMREEISERRNKLEINLKKIIKQTLLLTYGADDAKNVVLKKVRDHKKMSNLDYKDLFSSNKSSIYFSELKNIILSEWNLFKNVFDNNQERFIKRMDCINDLRIDAHAKNVSEEEFRYFRLSIKGLENQLDDFMS